MSGGNDESSFIGGFFVTIHFFARVRASIEQFNPNGVFTS
jgi:hypothetical protein